MYKKVVQQIVVCILLILLTYFLCKSLNKFISYTAIAIIFLFITSIVAVLFEIVPVIITAVFSALILNYFFIPPLRTFHIASTDDLLLFVIFFVVAIVNAILTYRIKKAQKKARDKEEKEKTIKLYNTLLNSLSHELRTPLATIIAATDTLQHNTNTLNNEQKNSLLNQVTIASNRLNEQVENLLNMSRLETGTLQLKKNWIDINEVITEEINKIEEEGKQQIIFNLNDNLPLINIDAGILQQVIQNILSNAIKYTPSSCKINITTILTDKEELEITIADNGNGVSDEAIQHLFEKFYRVPQTATGGTGLGLSIVKGYVEALGGKVVAKHNQPKGLCITLTLPVETSYINKLNND